VGEQPAARRSLAAFVAMVVFAMSVSVSVFVLAIMAMIVAAAAFAPMAAAASVMAVGMMAVGVVAGHRTILFRYIYFKIYRNSGRRKHAPERRMDLAAARGPAGGLPFVKPLSGWR
jgi:uncharacterized membrane-anchored protein